MLIQKALILNGRPGGQAANGGTGAGENLTLFSTAHATKGKLLLGISAYDEVNNRLGIGTASPTQTLSVSGGAYLTGYMTFAGSTAPAVPVDIYGASGFGLRMRSVVPATIYTDMYTTGAGTFIFDFGASAGSAAYLDIRTKNATLGTIIRDSSGVGVSSYLNIYSFDEATDRVTFSVTADNSAPTLTLKSDLSVTLHGTTFGAQYAAFGNNASLSALSGFVVNHIPTEGASTLSSGINVTMERGGLQSTAILSAGEFTAESLDIARAGTWRGVRTVVSVQETDGSTYTIPSLKTFIGEASVQNFLVGLVTVTDLMGIDLSTLTLSASPRVAVTTYTGIKLPTSFGVAPTTAISLDSQTTATMRHTGRVSIGKATAPNVPLDVVGDGVISGKLTVGATTAPTLTGLDVYGSNAQGFRIRGTTSATQIGDIRVDSIGAFIFETVNGGAANGFFDFRSKDTAFGTVIRTSSGADTGAYLNIYVVNAATDTVTFSVTANNTLPALTLDSARGARVHGALQLSGDTTVDDTKNFILSGTTGTKIGTATSQKLGFWNVTPIIQPAAAGQVAAAAQSQATLTDNTAGTAGTTLAAVTGSVYATDIPTIRNWIASLAARLAEVKTDVANVKTLEDAMRTALVNSGIMKGAA